MFRGPLHTTQLYRDFDFNEIVVLLFLLAVFVAATTTIYCFQLITMKNENGYTNCLLRIIQKGSYRYMKRCMLQGKVLEIFANSGDSKGGLGGPWSPQMFGWPLLPPQFCS